MRPSGSGPVNARNRPGVIHGAIWNPADARLIAAAPDLLEALEYALKDMKLVRAEVANNRLAVSISMARAAIAKATGSA